MAKYEWKSVEIREEPFEPHDVVEPVMDSDDTAPRMYSMYSMYHMYSGRLNYWASRENHKDPTRLRVDTNTCLINNNDMTVLDGLCWEKITDLMEDFSQNIFCSSFFLLC